MACHQFSLLVIHVCLHRANAVAIPDLLDSGLLDTDHFRYGSVLNHDAVDTRPVHVEGFLGHGLHARHLRIGLDAGQVQGDGIVAEGIAYLEKLRMIIQYLGASDCKLQEGSMRADVNLSVREVGAEEFGTRTEMKNLNSFSAIARAIEGEMERQIDLIEDGKKVVQETRRWDDDKEYSYPMRSKEDAQDYRYFPEPDLTPIVISDEWLDEIRSRQPEFRDEKQARYKEQFGLPEYDINIITEDKTLTDLFESCIELGAAAKEVSNWIMGDIMRLLKEKEMEASDIHFSPANLVKMIQMIESGAINRKVAKKVFEAIFDEDVDPEVYVEENGLKTVNDEGALRKVIEEIVANNPKSVEDYKAGKKKAMGFFVGQTMRAMKGKADPAMVNQILKEMLD